MNSIIRQIFLGEKGNCDNIKYHKKYYDTLDKAIICEKEFQAKIESNHELSKLYLKVSDTSNENNSESIIAHFAEGFKLGVLLGIELFSD